MRADRVFVLHQGGKRTGLNPREVNCAECGYLKIRFIDHDLALLYSTDGMKWRQYPVGIEMSGYHHNIFGGFGALSIGVYTKGTGRLRIDNFTYRALD